MSIMHIAGKERKYLDNGVFGIGVRRRSLCGALRAGVLCVVVAMLMGACPDEMGNGDGVQRTVVSLLRQIAHEAGGGPTLDDDDNFGVSVADVGDLDGGGGSVLAVGATFDDDGGGDTGAVYLLSFDAAGELGATTKITSTTENGPTLAVGDAFGGAIVNAGDLYGDGNTVLAVGASFDNTGGRAMGAIHLLSFDGAGVLMGTVAINSGTENGPTLARNDRFGASIANAGDLDGGGGTVLAVGAVNDATGAPYGGAIHLLSFDEDGALAATTKIAHGTANGPTLVHSDLFGASIANAGDLDGGGGTVLAVGARGDNTGVGNAGAVYLLSFDAAGALKATTKIAHETNGGPTLASGDTFGASVVNVGDSDGGGGTVLAVGAVTDNLGGTARGAVHLLSFDASGALTVTDKIAHESGGGPSLMNGDLFGSGVASIDDFGGSGKTVLAVGARNDGTGGTRRGAVYLLELLKLE